MIEIMLKNIIGVETNLLLNETKDFRIPIVTKYVPIIIVRLKSRVIIPGGSIMGRKNGASDQMNHPDR